ncbi:MAG TPA: carboxypeptidase-like regulatory domain-containing protein [Hymenobacter sp.]|jgi:hypothetical protein|uniref:carboxypeptidase-like regulatory domain-containing protein n=1 Tax=Hymenobacter sp. TaxID=1898978 RepID=UPI002EDAF730
MSTDNYPNQNNDQYDPNLDAQADELAEGGSNKLFYFLGALLLALLVGYIVLPKGQGNGLSSVTPTFMLDDAAVTATAPTAADSIAAGLKAAPASEEEANEGEAGTKAAAKPAAMARPAAAPTAAPVAAPAAAVTAAAPVVAPEPEPVAPAPAPEPAAAPANVTLSGRIEDENGRPLVGATVLLRGSSKGTSTDANGNYSIEVPGSADNTLVYGYGGYEDEVMRARGTQPVNVTLTPRAKDSRKRR